MNKEIRLLNKTDFTSYKSMQTGLKEDYIRLMFPGLTDGENRLYGLFIDKQLVSTAGYTVFANHFIMLGRLRSDVRYRGQNYGTEILNYAKEQAMRLPDIEFVGANTEKHNLPAQKVLKKIALPHVTTLYAAQTTDLSPLINSSRESASILWSEIKKFGRKKEWISRTYLNADFEESIFPFEAYYPFPASESLFKKELLESWTFYENEDQTRYMILWEEDKGDHYLHVTYPWDDFMKQPGFWETIDTVYRQSLKNNPKTLLWIDLSEEKANQLPPSHPFDLPSPWMLHGVHLDSLKIDSTELEDKMTDAYTSLEQLEAELVELEEELDQKLEKTDELKQTLDELDSK